MHRPLLFCVWVFLFGACVLAQTRPKLSEVFELHGIISLKHNGSLLFGESRWVTNQPEGKVVEISVFGGFEHLNVYDLARYDLQKNYQIINGNKRQCAVNELTGRLPPLWGWLEQAQFVRNFTSSGELYSLWSYQNRTAGNFTLEVGVPNMRPNELRFFSRYSASEDVSIYVQQWIAQKPHESWFEVPFECE